MSAILDSLLPLDHTAEEMAALDVHETGRRPRCAPSCPLLSDEQMSAVDDTMEFRQ